MAQNTQEPGAVSPQLDEMVCDLIGFMLDELAAGCDPGVVACMEDSQGNRSEAAFSDDGEEECLEAARALVARSAQGVPEDGVGPIARYAIGCVGGVQLDFEPRFKLFLLGPQRRHFRAGIAFNHGISSQKE